MKKLLFVLTASMIAGTIFAKLPPATNKDRNVIKARNGIEYSRRGSLGTMDYVVTDGTNLIHKGINSWYDDDEEDLDVLTPINSIYGIGVTYNPTNGQSTIKDPISGRTVPTAWYIRMEGHEFLSIEKPDGCPDQFSYFGQGQRVIMMNLPMCYGTNMVKGVEARVIILPYFGAADTDLRAPFNANYHYMADRTWVLQMLQAQANGTLNISGSGDTITASITRGGAKGGGDTRSLPTVNNDENQENTEDPKKDEEVIEPKTDGETVNNNENTEEPKVEEPKEEEPKETEEPKTEGETVNENTEEPKTDTDGGEKPAEEPKTEGENAGNESTNETPAEGNETQPVDNGGETSTR